MDDRNLTRAKIVDAFKRRAAKRLVYFHCDHWEPWKATTGGTFSSKNADDLKLFVDKVAQRDFARKLTLFYKCPVNYAFDAEPTTSAGVKVHPSDQIRFIDRRPAWMDLARSAIGYLQANSSHELQVHIHHENLTYNTGKKKESQGEYFTKPESRTYEEARYDFLVKETLRLIQEETGRPVANWLHVHGHWALNASDPDVCHLTREIEILLANGCVGDMTVPSGRSEVNPRIETPYFVSPVALPKGYDTQEARPEFAYGNKKAAGSKFFMWSSIIKHQNSSLDYYSDAISKRLIERDQFALAVANESVCIDGNLFFKTHAHSMHSLYYKETGNAVHPHLYPAIVDLLGLIFEAASEAGLDIVFETGGQVYQRFVNADYEPAAGYSLVLPTENPVVKGICPPPPSIGLAVLSRYPVRPGRRRPNR